MGVPPPPQSILPYQQLYVTLPELIPLSQNIPLFHNYNIMRPSQNIPLPPRLYPQQLYATLPEYTPPSQKIPPFLTTICDSLRIYPSLLEYTPLSNQFICATISESTPASQNLPPFQELCDFATLPKSSLHSQNIVQF